MFLLHNFFRAHSLNFRSSETRDATCRCFGFDNGKLRFAKKRRNDTKRNELLDKNRKLASFQYNVWATLHSAQCTCFVSPMMGQKLKNCIRIAIFSYCLQLVFFFFLSLRYFIIQLTRIVITCSTISMIVVIRLESQTKNKTELMDSDCGALEFPSHLSNWIVEKDNYGILHFNQFIVVVGDSTLNFQFATWSTWFDAFRYKKNLNWQMLIIQLNL